MRPAILLFGFLFMVMPGCTGGEGSAASQSSGSASGAGGDSGTGSVASSSSGGAGGMGSGGHGGGIGGGGAGGKGEGGSGEGGAGGCIACADPKEQGELSDDAMNEISGIAASAIHPDVFYVHNDSGDSPRFFAIKIDGKLLAKFSVSNASATDWEDIDRGPCPGALAVRAGRVRGRPQERQHRLTGCRQQGRRGVVIEIDAHGAARRPVSAGRFRRRDGGAGLYGPCRA